MTTLPFGASMAHGVDPTAAPGAVASPAPPSATEEAEGLRRAIVLRPSRVELIESGRLQRQIWRRPGQMSLERLARIVDDPTWLSAEPGGIYRLSAALVQAPGTDFTMAAPGVAQLQLSASTAWTAFMYGSKAKLHVGGVQVTGWDSERNEPAAAGPTRGWLHYRNDSTVSLENSVFAHLGRDGEGTGGVTLAQGCVLRVTGSAFRAGHQGLAIDRAARTLVENVTVEDSSGAGLTLERAVGAQLNGIASRRNNGHGIALTHAGGNNVLSGIEATGNSGAGLLAEGQSALRVRDVRTADNEMAGVQVKSGRDVEVTGHDASNDAAGILVAGASRGVALRDLMLRGGGTGVGTSAGVADLTIDNATVSGTTGPAYDLGGSGITVRDSHAARARVGFLMDGYATNVSLESVEIRQATSGVVARRLVQGLRVADLSVAEADTGITIAATNVVLDGIRLTGTETGVRLYGRAKAVTVSNLTVINPAVGVVATSSVKELQLRDVTVQQKSGIGVSSSAEGLTVQGAQVSGSLVAFDLHGSTTLQEVLVRGVRRGIVAGSGVEVAVTNSRVDSVQGALRVADGSAATVQDSRLWGEPAVAGEIVSRGDNEIRPEPLAWFGVAALVASAFAIVLELLRRLRERAPDRLVLVAPHVTNVR